VQGFFKRASLTAEAIAVRPAQPADRAAIQRLTEYHHRVHFNLDWWSFDQWLHDDRPSEAIWLAFDQQELIGLLAAPYQQSPVAWLRAMAVANGHSAAPVFAALLARARPALLACGVEQVAVLAHPAWVDDLMQRVNFTLYNAIITMRKSDRVVPGLRQSPAADIRPARPDDIPAIAENDRASFDTVWQHSAASLAHILRHVAHFVVAEIGDRVVGHAFSDIYGGHGHLIRLVVDLASQRLGIGEQLLRESLRYQQDVEAYPFTLNTQIDNASSQTLYRRYGYQLTGEPVRVMHRALREQ